jgi:hypothetical protein
MVNTRPLGNDQLLALEAICAHSSWPGAGWVMTNASTTKRILDSLVRRGLVGTNDTGSYRPTAAGVTLARSRWGRPSGRGLLRTEASV